MANCHVIFKSKTMKYVTISQNGELSRNFSIGIKKDPPFGGSFFMLAGAEGLEPSTRGFGDRCSTN